MNAGMLQCQMTWHQPPNPPKSQKQQHQQGAALASLAALSRVYSVQIVITPRPNAPAGEWARAASAVTQWWHTALMACLVLVVVR